MFHIALILMRVLFFPFFLSYFYHISFCRFLVGSRHTFCHHSNIIIINITKVSLSFANIPIWFLPVEKFFFSLPNRWLYRFCCGFYSSCLCKSITKIMTSVSLCVIINRIWHKHNHIALSMDINRASDTHTTHPISYYSHLILSTKYADSDTSAIKTLYASLSWPSYGSSSSIYFRCFISLQIIFLVVAINILCVVGRGHIYGCI